MITRGRTLLLTLVATLAFATALTGAASGNRFAVTETLARVSWAPIRFIVGGSTIGCNLTLEASFHSRTISKVNESLIGYVSGATVNTCTGGSSTILRETLPWHIRYSGFTGRLPNIERIRLRFIGASFTAKPSGSLMCLARTEAGEPAIGFLELNASHQVTGLTAEPNAGIALTGEGGFCVFGGSGHFEGTGVVRSSSGATVTVTLI